MVIIMQFFAANHDAPGRDVGAGVVSREVAVTPIVSDAVDDACGGNRNPRHLHRPNRETQRAKQQNIDCCHERDAARGIGRIEMTFDPIIRRALAVLFHGF